MGTIAAAYDPVLGRHVAVKTLRDEYRDDDLAIRSFVEEARTTGQLEHPNVVPVYDLNDSYEQPYIVMQLVDGQSLAELLADLPQPRDAAQAADLLERLIRIVLRLCDALSFAHGRGVFHCDVKPANVMVGEHGQVYLMDWGVALRDQPREAFAGTASYMAPEQLLGKIEEIDARTDVYGLGGILYEIITGRPPNGERGVLQVAQQSARDFEAREHWTRVPPELRRICKKALAPAQADRYPSVDDLRADLEGFLKGGGWFDTLAVGPGELIVRQGDPGDVAYVIQSGECDVWKLIGGERAHVRRLGPGDVFGEAAVFAPGPRTASVIAVGDVTLKVITGESLNRELDQNPMLAAFVRSLANLFREADQALSVPPSR
jgi:serine/threonine-protein kinase